MPTEGVRRRRTLPQAFATCRTKASTQVDARRESAQRTAAGIRVGGYYAR